MELTKKWRVGGAPRRGWLRLLVFLWGETERGREAWALKTAYVPSQVVTQPPPTSILATRTAYLHFKCSHCDAKYTAQYGRTSGPYRAFNPVAPLDTMLEPYPEGSAVQARCILCTKVFKLNGSNSKRFRDFLRTCDPPRGLRMLTVSHRDHV